MAVYKIFAQKDATIYSNYPSENTGLDEILEIGNSLGPDTGDAPQVMRALIKFDSRDITYVLNNLVSGSQFTASLKLFIADADSIPVDYNINCYLVSGSWTMGTGRFQDTPENNTGVSWTWRGVSGSNAWIPVAYSSSVTASYAPGYPGGGTYVSANRASQSFAYGDYQDINIDVTPLVKSIYSSSVNDGFLLKLDDSLEFQSSSFFYLKYFSVDTHTIYPPVLEFGWNNSTFTTSSAKAIVNDSNFVTTVKSSPYVFDTNAIQRFRLEARPQYPQRTFTTSSVYLTTYYLPQNSYYQVRDMDTNEVIVDFDNNNTKISADTSSSYFDIYMHGLQPERYYKIFIKTTLDGSTVVRDSNLTFKVRQ